MNKIFSKCGEKAKATFAEGNQGKAGFKRPPGTQWLSLLSVHFSARVTALCSTLSLVLFGTQDKTKTKAIGHRMDGQERDAH